VTGVFISYTESDTDWATWIAETVEEAGRGCTLQEWDSPAGGNFVTWINEQLTHADWVMPVYSPAYFASAWCTTEWTAAMARSALLPMKVADCRIPPVLASLTYVDLSTADLDTARQEIVYALRIEQRPRRSKGFPGGGGRSKQGELRAVRTRWQRIASELAAGAAVHDILDDDDDDG
jgi:hypothetical protein